MVGVIEFVGLGRASALNMKNAGHLLRYLFHFLCAEDGVTTESFSVRVCLLILYQRPCCYCLCVLKFPSSR